MVRRVLFRRGLQRWLLILALGLLGVQPARAVEPYQEFLRGLWDRGYGEDALAYLNQIQQRADLPTAVAESIDLALARSLLIAADEADSSQIATQRLASARTYLDKFLKEHPTHSEVPAANVLAGELAMARGDKLLDQAKALDDDKARNEKLREARSAFVEARPFFEQAADQYAKILVPLVEKEQAAAAEKARIEAKLAADKSKRPPPKQNDAVAPPAAPSPPVVSERQRVAEQWADARFKTVLVDYQISQTYSDLQDSRRFDALRSASDGFDEIFQLRRDDQLGMVAHFWQGRMLEELNDLTTAQDVFDEVLARASAGLADLAPAVVELLCDAESHKLQVLEKRKKLDLAIADAERWLSLKGVDQHPQANMGIQLQLAKMQLTKAKRSPAEQAATLSKSANATLMKVAAVPSRYQREALLLMQQQPGQGVATTNIQQAMSVASAAAGNGLWDEAISGYRRAIELGLEPRDHDRPL
jgi:hypothetical protein